MLKKRGAFGLILSDFHFSYPVFFLKFGATQVGCIRELCNTHVPHRWSVTSASSLMELNGFFRPLFLWVRNTDFAQSRRTLITISKLCLCLRMNSLLLRSNPNMLSFLKIKKFDKDLCF